jgi:hypothetical protein
MNLTKMLFILAGMIACSVVTGLLFAWIDTRSVGLNALASRWWYFTTRYGWAAGVGAGLVLATVIYFKGNR